WKTRTRRGSPLKKRWAGRRLRASELGDVAASTKIMLNVVDAPTWPGPNMRAFELAACGAFSLTTRSPALLEIFTEGESVACFDTADEAREVADRYLRDEAARQSIARAGREIVLAGHTWAHRVDTLVEWLAEDRSPAPGIARAAPTAR
ncbi:MAG TPA: glycosyltransferase, partial [Gemmatimonadaceae bacterium]|nr:glycosyltransferase [Gemmatimonadaceae bacterium]